ncbi:hypothetical protein D515_00974 [Grimontia indica]|uniref:Uncharacterized protein n=1 Tax=Grimontia indica TaxID=1056512 RepID=R1IGJ1_9GAMM|nr:hypothetical protein D515_00974 [Grimontia indica]
MMFKSLVILFFIGSHVLSGLKAPRAQAFLLLVLERFEQKHSRANT